MLDDPVQKALDDVAQVLGPIYVEQDQDGAPRYRSARLDALQTTVDLLTEQVALLQGRLDVLSPLRPPTAARRVMPTRTASGRAGVLVALRSARSWDRLRLARNRRRGVDLVPVLRPDLVQRLPSGFNERRQGQVLLPMPRSAAGVPQVFAVPMREEDQGRLLLLSSSAATAHSLAPLARATFIDESGSELAKADVLGIHASGDWELVEITAPPSALARSNRMVLTLTTAGAQTQLTLLALVAPDGTRTPVSVAQA